MGAMDEPEEPEVVEEVELVDEVEVLDPAPHAPAAWPVVAEVHTIESVSRPGPSLAAVQAAAAAATGFVAGAATLALARRYGARRVARLGRDVVGGGRSHRRPGDFWPTSGTTRTYVVRVHVLGRPGE
jgi:hypothetical protein